MYGNLVFVRAIQRLIVALLLCGAATPLFAGEVNLARTNWVERWITNLIEIRMPANRFLNEYHTNWVTQVRTNIIDVFATNLVTRTLTNQVVLQAFHTNLVTEWHTNWQVLNLTNWQTATVIKTNWTPQPAPAVVQVARPSDSSAVAAALRASAGSASFATDGLVLEASRAARPAANGQIEITLKVHAATGVTLPLQVQQWRIEREDGAVLCFGQDQDFKRELPVGRYKLEVRVQRETDSPVAPTRAILSVTPREVVLEQRLTAKR
jgi:hypothetical protein